MPSQSRQFVARMECFHDVRALVESFCLLANAGRDASLRLTLIVEELFTNSVHHGYGGDCDRPIWLSLQTRGDEIEIVYEDGAPEHDPFKAIAQPATSPHSQRVGGWGLRLVKEMGSSAHYARVGDRNRITVTMDVDKDAPG
jgi:serine/threonine-protein kinase RsbW